ncbi:unnamed protein product [Amoebophrya sp. A25]|nr:unnamed protein product [Amoebophrya sp. A25]|eukprot:GSA25T00005814001.1
MMMSWQEHQTLKRAPAMLVAALFQVLCLLSNTTLEVAVARDVQIQKQGTSSSSFSSTSSTNTKTNNMISTNVNTHEKSTSASTFFDCSTGGDNICGRGRCDAYTKLCVCLQGYAGVQCDMWISTEDMETPSHFIGGPNVEVPTPTLENNDTGGKSGTNTYSFTEAPAVVGNSEEEDENDGDEGSSTSSSKKKTKPKIVADYEQQLAFGFPTRNNCDGDLPETLRKATLKSSVTFHNSTSSNGNVVSTTSPPIGTIQVPSTSLLQENQVAWKGHEGLGRGRQEHQALDSSTPRSGAGTAPSSLFSWLRTTMFGEESSSSTKEQEEVEQSQTVAGPEEPLAVHEIGNARLVSSGSSRSLEHQASSGEQATSASSISMTGRAGNKPLEQEHQRSPVAEQELKKSSSSRSRRTVTTTVQTTRPRPTVTSISTNSLAFQPQQEMNKKPMSSSSSSVTESVPLKDKKTASLLEEVAELLESEKSSSHAPRASSTKNAVQLLSTSTLNQLRPAKKAVVVCSGHGKKVTLADSGASVCQCSKAWAGNECEVPRCLEDCSMKGMCVAGLCICGPTAFGSACQFDRCPRDCMGNGYCVSGRCNCNPGFAGTDCSTMVASGEVIELTLKEAPPKRSPAANSLISTLRRLKERTCADSCNMRGACHEGKCECYPGYSGALCQQTCPNECSHTGHCVSGQCMCFEGFRGHDCSQKTCCNGRGSCDQPGVCVCEEGYAGETCEHRVLAAPVPQLDVATCDPACSVHGSCSPSGHCVCKTGYIGADCGTKVEHDSCPHGCNARGLCLNGMCSCHSGWQGNACELALQAPGQPPAPSAAGGATPASASSDTAAAITELGSGPLSDEASVCGPEGNCSGHGKCDTVQGQCICEVAWTGKACDQPQCPGKYDDGLGAWNACHGKGLCEEGKCLCAGGWGGSDCGTKECAYDCGAHGSCSSGQCLCDVGWTGPNCKDPDCRGGCSGNGECIFAQQDSPGECRCHEGFTGKDCSQHSFSSQVVAKTCPNGCGGNGLCLFGQCSCSPGFTGSACETAECDDPSKMGPNCDLARCPRDCSGQGACMNGACVCWPDYSGKTCSIPVACEESCGGERTLTSSA